MAVLCPVKETEVRISVLIMVLLIPKWAGVEAVVGDNGA